MNSTRPYDQVAFFLFFLSLSLLSSVLNKQFFSSSTTSCMSMMQKIPQFLVVFRRIIWYSFISKNFSYPPTVSFLKLHFWENILKELTKNEMLDTFLQEHDMKNAEDSTYLIQIMLKQTLLTGTSLKRKRERKRGDKKWGYTRQWSEYGRRGATLLATWAKTQSTSSTARGS